MSDGERFLSAVSLVYLEMKRKMKAYCTITQQEWDEDVFSDTITKCYDTIEKQGYLKDNSSGSCINYLFKSFVTNIKRDKLYAREKKRDSNENLTEAYENYLEKTQMTTDEKILSDTKKDFTVLYILLKAKENFDDESFHLFQMKMLGNLTYKQLQQRTSSRAIRQKVSSVKRWLKDNISKEEIDKAFDDFIQQ